MPKTKREKEVEDILKENGESKKRISGRCGEATKSSSLPDSEEIYRREGTEDIVHIEPINYGSEYSITIKSKDGKILGSSIRTPDGAKRFIKDFKLKKMR